MNNNQGGSSLKAEATKRKAGPPNWVKSMACTEITGAQLATPTPAICVILLRREHRMHFVTWGPSCTVVLGTLAKWWRCAKMSISLPASNFAILRPFLAVPLVRYGHTAEYNIGCTSLWLHPWTFHVFANFVAKAALKVAGQKSKPAVRSRRQVEDSAARVLLPSAGVAKKAWWIVAVEAVTLCWPAAGSASVDE